MAELPQAPKTPKKTEILRTHGDERHDPYYWLRERENPEVMRHLKAENAYCKEMLRHTETLQEDLFEEMKSRIKEDDSSVPYKLNGYYYYTRFEKGREYPVFCRKKKSLEAPEEIMIDANEMAEGHSYFHLGGMSVSPDNRWLAFGEDTLGRRIYTIRFKNLESGEILEEEIPNTTGSYVWAADNSTGFYTVRDKTLRPWEIYRHRAGIIAKKDKLVYREDDNRFMSVVFKSKSRDYIIIGCSSTLSDEYRYLPAAEPEGEFRLFQARERKLEYGIAHYKDHWYIHTNKDGARNFKLMRCPLSDTGKQHWEEVIPHRGEVLLEGVELFRDHLVLEERHKGLNMLRVRRWESGEEHYIEFPEETYLATCGINPDFDSGTLRYLYSSLTTPASVIAYDMESREKTVLKEQEVLGGYDKTRYKAERLWAEADDGTPVAISLVYRKDLKKKDGNPLLLYGYGSYGHTVDPTFSSVRLSLLDRGFVYAITHVRGSQYMGHKWYEDGKLLKKKNTFIDFIACGRNLLEKKYARRGQLYAMGGSAGGLLIGAVANMEPSLFNGLVAQVPFVDVVTTMLDESIPLTTGEYDEWGNPNEEEYYRYIKSYSPYDNIRARKYPPILVTTGFHDSQVQYWEPAKWVARLREMNTGDNPVLLHCNLETGHSGASGRFESLRETALEYAFLLDLAEN